MNLPISTSLQTNKKNFLYQLGVPAHIPSWFDPYKNFENLLEKYDKEKNTKLYEDALSKEIILPYHFTPRSLAGMYALKRYKEFDLECLRDDILSLQSRKKEFVLKSYNMDDITSQHIGKMRLEFFFLLEDTLKFRFVNLVKSIGISNHRKTGALLEFSKRESPADLKASILDSEYQYNRALDRFNGECDTEVYFKPEGNGYEEIHIKDIFPRKVILNMDEK